MAQYYNIIADNNSIPIMVDDSQQICTVDGQRIQFVVQDLNSCINGGTRLLTYTPATQNSEHIFTQAVGEQLQSIDQRQNVYIINTEDHVTVPQDSLKPFTPETSNFVITDSKNPNDPQVQWVTVQQNPQRTMSTKDSGPSKRPKIPKTKAINVPPVMPPLQRIKQPPKPSPRSPLHPENPPQQIMKNCTLLNRNQQTLQSTPQMGFLSERIKQARMHGSKPVNPPPGPQKTQTNSPKPLSNPQRFQSSTPKPMNFLAPRCQSPSLLDNSQKYPEKMEVDQQNYPEPDSGSESIAYLQQTITNPQQTIVQDQITGNTVKMLVVLPTGEQRLITFDIPNEDCTVQDLLEQANIPPNGETTTVSLVKDPILHINYIVESGEGTITMEETQDDGQHDVRMTDESTESHQQLEDGNNSLSPVKDEPKFADNQITVCPYCGACSADPERCVRCARKFPEEPKLGPITPSTNQQKKEALIPIDNFYSRKKTVELPMKDVKKPKGRIGTKLPTTKIKSAIKEPECLTLSSDDEEENPSKKTKKPENMKLSYSLTKTNAQLDESEFIDKEPIITNNSDDSRLQDPAGRNGGDTIDEGVTTSLCCRTVRIGSYKYIPHEKVTINSTGLILSVPLLEDDKKTVTINVKIRSIVKVLIHFGKGMPVLFFYTNTKIGDHIRGVLGMQDPIGPYYDPAGKDNTHRRITLLPEKISDESKLILKCLFSPNSILEELNAKEANEILVKASPKDNLQNPGSRKVTTTPGTNGVVEKITVYPPPPAKGGIALNTEDYSCLGEDQFLNDAIIDFYLKYLTLEILSDVDQQRTHVFSSYFYKRLTSPNAQGSENIQGMTAAAKRHARVQKWTKNVNIFDKDFIVIPINEHAHWFLAIICFPGLVGVVKPPKTPEKEQKLKTKKDKKNDLQSVTIGNTTITPVTTLTTTTANTTTTPSSTTTTTITIDQMDDQSERDEAEGDDDELDDESDEDDEEKNTKGNEEKIDVKTEIIKQEIKEEIDNDNEVIKIPCILIFDSLAGPGRARVVATLRDYLSCEYVAKMGKEKLFNRDTIKGACPKVPQQSNFTDCGLYVLQYAEAFFKDPIKDYTLPIKSLKNWFEEIVVTRKREELSKLVVKLMLSGKEENNITLPVVQFPTMDGKLRPKPEEKKDEKKKEEEKETKEMVETPAKTIYTLVPAVLTSAGNLEIAIEKPKQSSAASMSYLRTKRVSRITFKETQGITSNETAAKRHKGDNDSCK